MTKSKFAEKLYNQAISNEMVEFNAKLISLNIHQEVKDLESIHSGGGCYHLCIHLYNGHIITLHYEHQDVEYSYHPYNNIDAYYEQDEDGFGYEYTKPNYEMRVARFDSIDTIIANFLTLYI